MVQAADLGNRHDATLVRVDGARFGRVLGEREVCASVLKFVRELLERELQLSRIHALGLLAKQPGLR